MRRAGILLCFLLFGSTLLNAQAVRGPFSFTDSLMRNSRIGLAGRHAAEPVVIKPSVWQPLPQSALDGSANPRYATTEADFVFYLLERRLLTDALVLLAQPDFVPSDTLAYLRGRALFEDLQFEAADSYLSSSSLEPALFYGTVAKAHLGRTDQAVAALKAYTGPGRELSDLQLSGLSLLQGDVAAYRGYASGFTYSDYALADSQRALDDIAKSISGRRSKSALGAAAMSAVLPGSGQLYAGSLSEALSAFFTVGALGTVTAVTWHKYGATSWRTLLAGTAFLSFYIGNIYGAYVSVGLHASEFSDETSALVMYHIHIPLRSVFR